MKDKILEAVQISKTYGEGESAVQALKASDLTIWKGEFASIIGSSGSGKSTLLKILGGLLPPTTGNVLLDGKDIYAMNAEQLAQVRRQKIGFIFQDFRLFPEYTVRDNILIPFYLDHRTPDEQMLRKLTEILGIAEKLDARPSQISGGQQQRLCIARALAVQPDILLMDEPTSALDPVSTLVVEQLACELKETCTLVVVTHNMQQAARISDSVAFFLLGELVEHAPTAQLFKNPSDPRTADYLTGRFG